MQFSKLRLVGFKSFVEPTEFAIERGLTGVVGPNGCGKSNLVEALRWVMGESSYKNMRASSMDDVIFSGSGNRPARNSAEVGLYLANDDRTAPPAFNDSDELQVSRRIEREAGSVYRINGRDVRAKDVQLLFADVSTGARSPSMIGQGRIGELISAKPVARRALLEEAAGISGLHSRRHEAELRLRATETNLDRVEDVVVQLETQLDALKRQARQAARYRNVAADIRRTEAAILHLRWRAARDAAREAEHVVQKATVATAEAGLMQSEAARVQAVIAHELPALREAEAAEAAALQHVRIRRDQLDREQKAALARRRELEARIEQLAADRARERRMVEENSDVLAHLRRERDHLTAQAEGHDDAAAEAARTLEKAAEVMASAEREADVAAGSLAEARAARSSADKAANEAQARAARVQRQADETERDLAGVEARIGEMADLEALSKAVAVAEQVVADREQAAREAEGELEAARAEEAAASAPLAELRTRLSGLETEAKTLARVIQAGANGGGAKPVLDEVSARTGYERALATALGSDLDASREEGAALRWTLADANGDPPLPEGMTPLAEYVTAPAELHRRLWQVGVVEGSPSEATIATLGPGQTCVSRDGALWRWDGFRARADALTPAAQRLQQRNRLEELEGERETAGAALERAAAAHGEAKDRLGKTADVEREARERVRGERTALDGARGALSKAERAVGDLGTRRSVLQAATARLADEKSDALAAVEQATQALADLPDTTESEDRVETARRAVASARQDVVEARTVRDAIERDGRMRGERLAAIEREEKAWLDRATNAERQIAIIEERAVDARAQAEALEAEPDAFEARRREILNAIGAAEERRSEAADRLADRENDLREADKAAQSALHHLSSAKETAGRAEERATAARERVEEIEARIREDMRCEPHETLARAEVAEDALGAVGALEKKLERYRAERERLGAVNLRAEDEANEVREHRDRLVEERDELIEAIRKLRGAIGSLNREGRERLLEAFGKVDREFTRLFTHLFGGGTAQLQLVESDDPLEAGLEILARPPGKRPQTMTLLSGGEQALTAMALIFAVFLTNPAPICVLDEVDAPLDDHNVARFCNLMDEMAEKTDTRFVIITHNPITMARMNRLFGVTMGERGVSQLVSVDLDRAEELAEAG